MNNTIKLPLYAVDSDLLKTMLGVKDRRAVISRLQKLGIPIITRNNVQVVLNDDLEKLDQTQMNAKSIRYKPKSTAAKQLKGGDE